MPRKPKAKVEADDEDVAKAKRAMGLTVITGEGQDQQQQNDDQRESLEHLNGLAPQADPPASPIRRREYQRKLFTTLEGEAYLEANRSMLLAMDEKDQLETSRKAVVAEWKGIIDRKEEEVQGFRHKMSQGKAELVTVEELYDTEKKLLRVVRMDNNEVLEDWRPLTGEEQQLDMADLDAKVGDDDTAPAEGGALNLELEEHPNGDPSATTEEGRARELGLPGPDGDDEDQDDEPAGDRRGLPGALPTEE